MFLVSTTLVIALILSSYGLITALGAVNTAPTLSRPHCPGRRKHGPYGVLETSILGNGKRHGHPTHLASSLCNTRLQAVMKQADKRHRHMRLLCRLQNEVDIL